MITRRSLGQSYWVSRVIGPSPFWKVSCVQELRQHRRFLLGNFSNLTDGTNMCSQYHRSAQEFLRRHRQRVRARALGLTDFSDAKFPFDYIAHNKDIKYLCQWFLSFTTMLERKAAPKAATMISREMQSNTPRIIPIPGFRQIFQSRNPGIPGPWNWAKLDTFLSNLIVKKFFNICSIFMNVENYWFTLLVKSGSIMIWPP